MWRFQVWVLLGRPPPHPTTPKKIKIKIIIIITIKKENIFAHIKIWRYDWSNTKTHTLNTDIQTHVKNPGRWLSMGFRENPKYDILPIRLQTIYVFLANLHWHLPIKALLQNKQPTKQALIILRSTHHLPWVFTFQPIELINEVLRIFNFRSFQIVSKKF